MSEKTSKPEADENAALRGKVEEAVAKVNSPLIAMASVSERVERSKLKAKCLELVFTQSRARDHRPPLAIAQELFDWIDDPDRQYVAPPPRRGNEKPVDHSRINRPDDVGAGDRSGAIDHSRANLG